MDGETGVEDGLVRGRGGGGVRFESGQATGDSKATGNRNRDADPRWVLCVELRQASHMADARSIPSSCFQSNSRRGASQARLAAGEQRAALSRTHTRRGDVDGTRHPAALPCALARYAAASAEAGPPTAELPWRETLPRPSSRIRRSRTVSLTFARN